MARIDEFQIQRAFCLWFKGERNRDGSWRVVPAALPTVICWSTPNGGTRRDGFEGSRMKETGLEPGIPDLFAFHRARLFGIEFKAPGKLSHTSPAQDSVRARLREQGATVVVLDSVRNAAAQVIAWGLVRPDAIVPPFHC